MKEPEAAEKGMTDSLEQLRRAGAEFFIDGEAVSLTEAVRRTVQEEYAYMADYVVDRTGKVEM